MKTIIYYLPIIYIALYEFKFKCNVHYMPKITIKNSLLQINAYNIIIFQLLNCIYRYFSLSITIYCIYDLNRCICVNTWLFTTISIPILFFHEITQHYKCNLDNITYVNLQLLTKLILYLTFVNTHCYYAG